MIIQFCFLFIINCINYLPIGEEGEDADLDAPKIYEPIPSLDSLAEKLNSYMEQYNETIRGAKMDLVFFKVGLTFCILQGRFDLLFLKVGLTLYSSRKIGLKCDFFYRIIKSEMFCCSSIHSYEYEGWLSYLGLTEIGISLLIASAT